MDKTFFEIRNPERIDALLSEYQWMKLLKNRGHKYEMLLDYMIDLGEYESMDEANQESKRREVTKISKTLGISPQIVSRWLHEIYNDIWELNYDTPKLFQKKKSTAMSYTWEVIIIEPPSHFLYL